MAVSLLTIILRRSSRKNRYLLQEVLRTAQISNKRQLYCILIHAYHNYYHGFFL